MSIAEYQRHLQEAALNAKYIPGIVLYVDAKAAEPFSGLGGKMVTIRGKCKGTTEDQSTQPGYFVTLESVQLVRASSPEVVVRRPEKPVAKPPVEPPPGEKVLDLIEVVRLEDKWRQAREEFVERDGSNMVASNELQKAQDNERTPLVGRVVEGVVIIPWVGGRQKGNSDTVCINVNFGRVEVSLPTEVWQGGRMVKVRGTITRSTSGIYLENCTFSVPAKEDRAVPRSLKPPLPIADVIRQELQRKTEESVALKAAGLANASQIPIGERIPDPYADLNALLKAQRNERYAVSWRTAEGTVEFREAYSNGAKGGMLGWTVILDVRLSESEVRPIRVVAPDDTEPLLRKLKVGQKIKINAEIKFQGGVLTFPGSQFAELL